MSFTNNPSASATDRIRLFVGDVDTSLEWLSDGTYQYLLTKYNDNEKKAAREAMQYILFSLARRTRERAYQCEIYGDQMFANYERALKLAISNPELYSVEFTPYAGGISRTDMNDNVNDVDTPDAKLFRGVTSYDGQPDYLNKTVYSETSEAGF